MLGYYGLDSREYMRTELTVSERGRGLDGVELGERSGAGLRNGYKLLDILISIILIVYNILRSYTLPISLSTHQPHHGKKDRTVRPEQYNTALIRLARVVYLHHPSTFIHKSDSEV